jgi:hypothetical protein
MHRIAYALIFAAATASLIQPAAAVPSAVQHQGRLLDANGIAVNGPVTLGISLFTAESGGDLLWSGSPAVVAQDGYYSVVLGTTPMTPIDSTALAGSSVWLELTLPGASASDRTALTSVPFAIVAERLDDEVVQIDDARLVYSSTVIDTTACANDGEWCNYGEEWGENRLSTEGVYTHCTGWDCSDDYVDVVLDNNPWRTVMMSHLDWANTGAYDVMLSFDGGLTYAFHKRVETNRRPSETPHTSVIRTLATNLPIGSDVRVRVQGAYKRIHIDGFAFSRNLYPEERSGAACPPGTVGVTGFCIQPETTAAFGQSWLQANDHCTNAGLRLCGHEEMLAGLRQGAVEMYDYNVRDAWFVTADLSESTPGQSGYNQTCDIQGNSNQPSHPVYSTQCNHDMGTTAVWRTTVCCH